jgi:hypothetical protein
VTPVRTTEDRSGLAAHLSRIFRRFLPREQLDKEVFHLEGKRVDLFAWTSRINDDHFELAKELLLQSVMSAPTLLSNSPQL